MRVETIMVSGALFALACTGSSASHEGATWQLDHVEAHGALLSVWGSAPEDVWVVGGQRDEGLILHGDGLSWQRVHVEAPGILWWVYGFSAHDVYAVGEGGLILHYDGQGWSRLESGTDKTLFGVWGESGEVWVVGGDPWGEPGDAVVLRGEGEIFSHVDLPAEMVPRAFYKTYGIDSHQLLLVGTDGTILRHDGNLWHQDPVPTDDPIISLWGRGGDDIYAVGGAGVGRLLHFSGDGWHEVTSTAYSTGLSGVYTAPDHPVIAVGADFYVLEIGLDGSRTEPEAPMQSPLQELHGVWGDGAGTTYAVGGDLHAYPGPMSGVILRRR
jgi:hypothetical protein